MGDPGIEVIEKVLAALQKEKKIDLVIAQAENVTDGRGISKSDFERLRKAGVDFCTGGNWSLYREDIFPALSDPAQPIIRPANYPGGTPGLGWKYINGVLVISLLGKIVGKDADNPVDNPLQVIDQILDSQKDVKRDATIVNFHGDYSSEKVIIGHYLDGRVTAVVGDHWHVPTADERILRGGTGHITDVGMCGVLDASLGISFESVIPRWRNGNKSRNVLETSGPRQFNAVLIESEAKSGLANSIERVRMLL